MARKILVRGLLIIQILFTLHLLREANTLRVNAVQAIPQVAQRQEGQVIAVSPYGDLSCANPTAEQEVVCTELEARILASTLCIEMQGWVTSGNQRRHFTKGSLSHATVIAGRYLVTHNHFSFHLKTEGSENSGGYTGISLRNTDGNLILEQAPLTAFSIAYEDTETLILEFVDDNGNGLFETLRVASTPLLDWESVPWQIGMEVAVLDWDGEVAHVDWAPVEALRTDGQVTWIEVKNYAMRGASGGGVYWNGYHVGNNWSREVENNTTTHEVNRAYTNVALNSAAVYTFVAEELPTN